jgi:hypothetical protein
MQYLFTHFNIRNTVMQNMTKTITKICKPISNMQNTDRSIFCIFVIYLCTPTLLMKGWEWPGRSSAAGRQRPRGGQTWKSPVLPESLVPLGFVPWRENVRTIWLEEAQHEPRRSPLVIQAKGQGQPPLASRACPGAQVARRRVGLVLRQHQCWQGRWGELISAQSSLLQNERPAVVIGRGLTPVKIIIRLRLQKFVPGVSPQPLVRVLPTS